MPSSTRRLTRRAKKTDAAPTAVTNQVNSPRGALGRRDETRQTIHSFCTPSRQLSLPRSADDDDCKFILDQAILKKAYKMAAEQVTHAGFTCRLAPKNPLKKSLMLIVVIERLFSGMCLVSVRPIRLDPQTFLHANDEPTFARNWRLLRKSCRIRSFGGTWSP